MICWSCMLRTAKARAPAASSSMLLSLQPQPPLRPVPTASSSLLPAILLHVGILSSELCTAIAVVVVLLLLQMIRQ